MPFCSTECDDILNTFSPIQSHMKTSNLWLDTYMHASSIFDHSWYIICMQFYYLECIHNKTRYNITTVQNWVGCHQRHFQVSGTNLYFIRYNVTLQLLNNLACEKRSQQFVKNWQLQKYRRYSTSCQAIISIVSLLQLQI